MTITFTVPDEIVKNSFDEIISPLQKRKPKWLSALRSRGTVRSCPSFTWQFRDSLIVRLPCDVMMYKDGGQFKIDTLNETLMEVFSHSLDTQLSEEHAKDFVNLKIRPMVSYRSSKPVKAVQMTSFNYTTQDELLFRSVEGVFPIIKENTQLNINLFLRTSEIVKRSQAMSGDKEVLISSGTPLCLLYFPQGIPKTKVAVGNILKNDVRYKYKDFKNGLAKFYFAKGLGNG
jgi:hypothetical protein